MVANKAYLLLAICIAASAVGLVGKLWVLAAPQVSWSRAEPAVQSRQLLQVAALLDTYRGGEGQLRHARELLEALLREDPRYAPAHRELARYFILAGQAGGRTFRADSLRAAEVSLQMALSLDPHYADAYVLAGHLYQLMRRPLEARAALLKAENLGAKDPWLHTVWADLLIAEGDYDDAAQRYRAVINAAASSRQARMAAFEGLTRYYKRAGRLDEADAVYRQAIHYEPANALNYGNYAVFLLCVRDNYEAAIEQSRHALTISNYGAGRYILASALYRQWAAQLAAKRLGAAQLSAQEAASLQASPPAKTVAAVCGEGPVLKAVNEASLAGR